jgi:hypothetical protein
MLTRAKVTAALALVSLLVGCGGGPLEHTAGPYDPVRVNALERAKVDRAEAKAAEARKKNDSATAAIDAAEERADAAEDEADDRHDAVSGAESRLAKVKLQQTILIANEATASWLVALAELELAKHVANQGRGAANDRLTIELDKQLDDLHKQHEAAQKALAAFSDDVKDAEASLTRAKSGG